MLEVQVTDTVTINVDGELAQVPKGVNVIEAMRVVGKEKEIPHYCYHPKLSVVGNCRMCLVEVGNPMRDRQTGEAILDENGTRKLAGRQNLLLLVRPMSRKECMSEPIHLV